MNAAVLYVLLTATTAICVERKFDAMGVNDTDKSYLMSSVSCRERCHETRSHGDVTVNCTKANCTDVPDDLSSDTTKLILVANLIRVIKKNAFVFLVNLVYLDLSYGEIRTFQKGSFEPLTQLKCLNISYNLYIKRFPGDIFSHLRSLTVLKLKGTSKICTFNRNLFKNLVQLERLAYNENRLISFPRFQRTYYKKPLLPKLKQLNLKGNNIEDLAEQYFRGLEESLETLNLDENKIRRIASDSFAGMTKLKRLYLDRNHIRLIGCYAFRSQSLEYLTIAYAEFNEIHVNKCDRDILKYTPNLKYLGLRQSSGLRLLSIPSSSPKHHLTALNLIGTSVNVEGLVNITKTFQMLQRLNLHSNQIDSLRADLWNNLGLKKLDIGNNLISNINITSFPPRMWSSLNIVNFADNPFYCDCDLVWFRQWLRKTNATILESNQTRCSGPPERKGNILVHAIRPTPLECFTADRDWFFPNIVLLWLVIIATAFVISILHKFRWYLKYWYFKTKNKAMRLRDFLDETQYEFDAFVSFSESDSDWVIGTLCQVLESQHNLRLCVHYRDWMIGRDIVTNIIDSIEKSRKTLMIVSNAFAASQWCHFEMTMAQTKLFEDDRDNLILVLLEEIADCNMNPRLQLQMQRKTYVEWTENQVGQQLFWEKLREAISSSATSIVNSVPPRELFVSQEKH